MPSSHLSTVDYQKVYGRVWHVALLVRLWRFGMTRNLSKIINSWLKYRKAYAVFGEKTSRLINCIGAHSGHLFADDLGILIRLPIMEKLALMIQYLEEEGTRIPKNGNNR